MVEEMMKSRDDIELSKEMKFRKKLVEYLKEWVMGK
jgi:hypothetical protein